MTPGTCATLLVDLEIQMLRSRHLRSRESHPTQEAPTRHSDRAPTTYDASAASNIGLFVDIGSESFFSNLKVTPN
jgi:hypothetical protein